MLLGRSNPDGGRQARRAPVREEGEQLVLFAQPMQEGLLAVSVAIGEGPGAAFGSVGRLPCAAMHCRSRFR